MTRNHICVTPAPDRHSWPAVMDKESPSVAPSGASGEQSPGGSDLPSAALRPWAAPPSCA
jgi:hypothetical protein